MTSYNYRKIILNNNTFMVPMWILDDVGDHYQEVYTYIVSEHDDYVVMDAIWYEHFIQLRKQIYWVCHWYYDLVNAKIPVIPSNIVSTYDLIHDLKLTHTSFLRCCNASPKDISTCIFDEHDSIDKIMNILKSSNRTNYILDSHNHIVIRPVVVIGIEVRCIWHKYKLRAVSCPTFLEQDQQENVKAIVVHFYNTYGKDIMINSAIFDLNIVDNN